MKKPPSKIRYFSKIAEFFNTAKNGPSLPRQLKTHTTFSMFPILGTNLCPKHCTGAIFREVFWPSDVNRNISRVPEYNGFSQLDIRLS